MHSSRLPRAGSSIHTHVLCFSQLSRGGPSLTGVLGILLNPNKKRFLSRRTSTNAGCFPLEPVGTSSEGLGRFFEMDVPEAEELGPGPSALPFSARFEAPEAAPAPPPLPGDRSSWARARLTEYTHPPSKPVLPAVLQGSWACCLILICTHVPESSVPQTSRSCWKAEPLASVDGWMRHSSGGESSSMVPSPTRMRRACSQRALVAKGQTGALFLLGVEEEEGTACFLMGCLNIDVVDGVSREALADK
jgi:hypothetical protein